MCLCTTSDGNLLTCQISSSLELWLVRFVFSNEEDEEEDEESVRNMFICISYLVRYFHTIFCMQLPFDMFSTLITLEVRLN